MTKTKLPGGRTAVALLVAVVATASAANAQDLSWIDWDKVAAREVVFRTGKLDRWTVTIDVAISVRASQEVIWGILTNCEVAPEYVPNVVSCERIDTINEGRSELFNQTVKPIFLVPRFEHVFRLDYFPPDRIDVRRVSGPLTTLDGTWRLPQQEDGTVLLTHSLRLRAGIPLPPFLVRATLKRDLPVVLTEIRNRAEAATSD